MTWPLRESYGGATRLGFADIIVIAIVMAILLFASWKQFPAYNRPFIPRAIRTPQPASANARTYPHFASAVAVNLKFVEIFETASTQPILFSCRRALCR